MRSAAILLLCVLPAAAPLAAKEAPGAELADPEPADAQARAEAVAPAPWNLDKVRSLGRPAVTRLSMHITRLVDHTTGVAGSAAQMESPEASIDERLTRLGADVGETEVTIRLPGSILFDFDSYDIRTDAEQMLRELSAVLKAWPERPVRIEGHTDSIASESYNQRLSERRATSVRNWLVGDGVDGRRLSPVGHGEARPVADNATAAGRQRNRRVEVVIGSDRG